MEVSPTTTTCRQALTPGAATAQPLVPIVVGCAGQVGRDLHHFRSVGGSNRSNPATNDLITFSIRHKNVQEHCNPVVEYDVRPFGSMLALMVWADVEPPKGTVYNDPLRPFHVATPQIAALPVPPDIAVQNDNRGTMPPMLAKLKSGSSVDQGIAQASDELEGVAR